MENLGVSFVIGDGDAVFQENSDLSAVVSRMQHRSSRREIVATPTEEGPQDDRQKTRHATKELNVCEERPTCRRSEPILLLGELPQLHYGPIYALHVSRVFTFLEGVGRRDCVKEEDHVPGSF